MPNVHQPYRDGPLMGMAKVSRSLPEWVGDTPDTSVPARVRIRVFDRKNGRCHRCTRKILAGETWTCEHLTALCNGGKNTESNLGVTCCNCLAEKNAEDVGEKSDVYQKRARHLGIETKSKHRWNWGRR